VPTKGAVCLRCRTRRGEGYTRVIIVPPVFGIGSNPTQQRPRHDTASHKEQQRPPVDRHSFEDFDKTLTATSAPTPLKALVVELNRGSVRLMLVLAQDT
jgi:hypothetical protein